MARRRRPEPPELPAEWNFKSFPVYFGFISGAFLTIVFINILAIPPYPLFVVALFGFSFGLAHISTHWLRRRTLDKRMQEAGEDERERRVLAARAAATRETEPSPPKRRRRRRGGRSE